MSGLRERNGSCGPVSSIHGSAGDALRDLFAPAMRRVFWIGDLAPGMEQELADIGWRAISLDERDAATALGRADVDVAVVDIQDGEDARLAALEHLIAGHHELQWLAIVSKDALNLPRVRGLILDLCFDYVSQPLHVSRLGQSLGHAWGRARLLRARPGHAVHTVDTDDMGLIGSSTALRDVRARIRKFARVDMPVLLTGETGTGKDVAARALWSLSARRDAAFGAIDCGALPENLVQSELFGHERGAFTGAAARKIGRIEAANGGVVFLDEIGDLPLDAQSNLLRFLQENTVQRVGSTTPVRVDTRVIAATHVDLQRAVREGRFREDLYYRLNVLHLELPPLREREHDAGLLAAHFLAEFRRTHRTRVRGFTAAARSAIAIHAWPGNVRELVNRVNSAAVVADKPLLEPADLGLAAPADPAQQPSLLDAREDAERATILASLRQSRFNLSECARRLKISRVTLYRLCKKYRLRIGPAALALVATIELVRESELVMVPLRAWLEAAQAAAPVLLG